MIILLTYGPQCIHDPMKFDHLLDAWFPADRKQMPKVIYSISYKFIKYNYYDFS